MIEQNIILASMAAMLFMTAWAAQELDSDIDEGKKAALVCKVMNYVNGLSLNRYIIQPLDEKVMQISKHRYQVTLTLGFSDFNQVREQVVIPFIVDESGKNEPISYNNLALEKYLI